MSTLSDQIAAQVAAEKAKAKKAKKKVEETPDPDLETPSL